MADTERERIARLIRNLQERTIERGFSENEAIAAARKISELLYEYNLQLSETEIADEPIGKITIDLDRKYSHPVIMCTTGIAKYTSCKVWMTRRNSIKVHFFGRRSDVAIAKYIFTICRHAIDTESERFRRSETYQYSESKRASYIAFGNGMALTMGYKLREMAKEEQPEAKTANGTALVALKNQLVEEKYAELNMTLTRSPSSRAYNHRAYEAGMEAGKNVTFSTGVEASPQPKLLPEKSQ